VFSKKEKLGLGSFQKIDIQEMKKEAGFVGFSAKKVNVRIHG
jgi:hypothetical protein